jgi:hypothetical protein
MLGFYPSVLKTSQFMPHDWKLLAWKVNSDQNISLEVIANLARTMWLRMMRLYSAYAIFGIVTSSTMYHDEGSAEAVVRDSSERRLLAVYNFNLWRMLGWKRGLIRHLWNLDTSTMFGQKIGRNVTLKRTVWKHTNHEWCHERVNGVHLGQYRTNERAACTGHQGQIKIKQPRPRCLL